MFCNIIILTSVVPRRMAATPASRNIATEGLDEPKEEKTKNQGWLVKWKQKRKSKTKKKTKEKEYETHLSSSIDIGISRLIHPEG